MDSQEKTTWKHRLTITLLTLLIVTTIITGLLIPASGQLPIFGLIVPASKWIAIGILSALLLLTMYLKPFKTNIYNWIGLPIGTLLGLTILAFIGSAIYGTGISSILNGMMGMVGL